MNIFKKNKKKDVIEKTLLINEKTNFNIIESYKSIRANINFAFTNKGCKKIMMCSSYSSEGKTTTCINLAITIAQTGSQVLLIDCDLRKPKIHDYLDIENDEGLTNFLSNMAELEDVVKTTKIDNLSVITSGTIPPNPAELLMSSKFEQILKIASQITDYIIIDTPPLCVVSDALPISKQCDGVILIVKHLQSKHPLIQEALEKLNFAGANIAGIILNSVKISTNKKYYSKYNKYYQKEEYRDKEEDKNTDINK